MKNNKKILKDLLIIFLVITGIVVGSILAYNPIKIGSFNNLKNNIKSIEIIEKDGMPNRYEYNQDEIESVFKMRNGLLWCYP